MIKIPHTIADLDIMAVDFMKDLYSSFPLRLNLQAVPAGPLKAIASYLDGNLDKIITGRPNVLEQESTIIGPLIQQAVADYLGTHPPFKTKKGVIIKDNDINKAKAKKIILKQIALIFDYDQTKDSFVKNNNGAFAYRHAERLNMSTCPYCNANFTFTIRSKKMKCRPQFDHFLNKKRHPYFGLSFFNLIPCCALCNSGAVKGQKEFNTSTHIHPFIEDLEGLYQFRINIRAVDFLVGKKAFDVELQPCKPVNNLRANASIEVFGLRDRYAFHKDVAGEVLSKAYMYNETAIKNLFKSFKVNDNYIFASESEVKELIMGNYLHPDHFHKRILSKLTRDIAEEFGLTI